ncbi:MAG: phosphate ABC transporter, permease protein PstA, partial [Desulfovibrionaceae bacterium]|nr:phosphate ABC transporter, permease protein PstA [Desulfovibrionaceae bacterium]
MSRRKAVQAGMFGLFRAAALINGLALLVIVFFLLKNGAGSVTWEFLTEQPYDSTTRGGILPCIVGTLILGLGAMLVAFPLGVASAVFLSEYAAPGRA